MLETGIFSGIVESAISAADSICKAVGGVVMTGVGIFVEKLREIQMDVVRIISKIITAVADIILEKPMNETPEELGMKVELESQKGVLGVEDFESVEAYIEHLRNDIQIDQARLARLTDEERLKYSAIGTGLYSQAIGEKYGMRLEPEFWQAIHKTGIHAESVPAILQSLKDSGVEDGKALDSYLACRRLPVSWEQEAVLYRTEKICDGKPWSPKRSPSVGNDHEYASAVLC